MKNYDTKITYGKKTIYSLGGKKHRLDGPAVELENGGKEYWVNDKLHRIDGPACEYSNGDKEYWVNGKLHREDGPAIILGDNNGEYYYYLNDEEIFEKEYFMYLTKFQYKYIFNI